jgi:hypothetical protein
MVLDHGKGQDSSAKEEPPHPQDPESGASLGLLGGNTGCATFL